MKVAVTRLQEKEENTVGLFEKYDVEAITVPTIRSRPPQDPASFDLLVRMVNEQGIDLLIFTSSLGVSKFFEKCDSVSSDTTILSVGPKTAQKVNEFGYPSEVLDSFSSDKFAEYLKDRAQGKVIGIARASVPNPELVVDLESLGATVVEGVCYELESAPNELKKIIADHKIDAVVITSTKSFLSAGLENTDVSGVVMVAIGPKTAKGMMDAGVDPDVVGGGTLESCAVLLQDMGSK
ncbi:MAG TPA: uroporphyrinogen-III synthase [Methanosarcinaceae archaeon]|nr:uroporphyrinogen-III synthase [Methanosarcinaceae archaeon]